MATYMTEEEQLELIKKWWKRHGNKIAIALSVVLLLIAGKRYYQWHEDKITQLASNTYEQMMLAMSNQNNKAVRSYANELVQNHSKSVYADAAHLTLAKIFVAKNQEDKAQNELQQVISQSRINALKQIAKIRLARILAAKKSYELALTQLDEIVDKTYSSVINELKGDIFGAKGDYSKAMAAYKLALDEAKDNGMGNLFLEMKSNEMIAKKQSVGVDVKETRAA